MDTQNQPSGQPQRHNQGSRYRPRTTRHSPNRQGHTLSNNGFKNDGKSSGLHKQRVGGTGPQNRPHRFHKRPGGQSRNTVQKGRYNNKVYNTASATNWNNSSEYRFKNYNGPKVKIIPISGVEMVGTNCTVIEYEDDIMIIDAGLGFPGEDLSGVDALVPNLNYLKDKLHKVRGLVITHGHTDHIGGLHYVYEKMGFPQVFAPRLAAEMIREKFKETTFADRLNITEIDGESSYYLGKFHLSHFRMNHTIMDNYGIVIDTPVGRIVTPSDYKFDLTPYKESPSDYSKLSKLGDEGVLLLLDESTNVRMKGWAPSETTIARDLEDTVRDANGRLIIGMFSTMISRIRQISEIAARYDKKIAVLGRSLDTNIKISYRLGYIDVNNSVFVNSDDINKIPDDRLVILSTGSQGEPNAALMRLAKDEHQKLKLKTTDTVVFSSSRIPGNEGKIDKLINLIASKGCRILTNEHLTLHASGHGCQEDHKLMLQLTKPKFLMPIHGDTTMLTQNKELAKSLGFEDQNVIISHDGSIIELWPDGWEITGEVESTPSWIEGNRMGDFDPEIVTERQLMTDEGIVIAIVNGFNKEKIETENLIMTSKGFFLDKSDKYLANILAPKVVEYINRLNPNRKKDTFESEVRRFIENEIIRYYEKKPLISVIAV